MKLDIYHVDAFAKRPFEGNPAAVVPLEEWLADDIMQSIAQQNNLSETAFFVPDGTGYHIRWFTPASEVRLCGHATLASAHVLFNRPGVESDAMVFDSLSGRLTVTKDNERLTMDFPSEPPMPCEIQDDLVMALGKEPDSCWVSDDYFAVFKNENDIVTMAPDFERLKDLDLRGVIVTAPAGGYDFVTRFFAPKIGIPEDPVTGSAFTRLIPYWADRLGKNKLSAKQISSRGGEVMGELRDGRVLISGSARLYLVGQIEI